MSSTQLPPPSDPGTGVPEDKQIPDPTVSILNADDNALYLLQESEDEDNDPFSMGQATPFQVSQPMPPVQHTPAGAPTSFAQSGQVPPTPPPQGKRRKFPPLLVAVIATLVVVVLVTTVMTAFAQTTPTHEPTATVRATPGQPASKGTPRSAATPVVTQRPTGPATPTVHPPAAPALQASGPATWTNQKLPDGWRHANLAKSDEIEADRTALSFTDREMGLDFRDVGSRAAHGGTFTAAFFILTPAAKARFPHNDLRVINNTLFDRVASQKLIEAAVDATPRVVKFQQQGAQQLAWVDVSFHLWQSRIDVNTPQQRVEGLDMDQNMQQPRTHHMVVLLLRAAPEKQGPGAPMGGTGWLVSNYGLDQPAFPNIVQPA